LTLRTQLRHHVRCLRGIPATVFFPRPDVDSAVVQMLPRDPRELPAHDGELVRKLIRLGFSQRRKQLRKLLREQVNDWDSLARQVDVDPKARAEELSLLQWIALANFIAPPPHPDVRVTNEERFPVVDKNDRILRDASRSQVHANNLRHRAVHILILNPAGEVYLQQRSRWKDRHPLKWDSSAAGHVTATERYDETARRELKEELGVSVPLKKISKLPPSELTDHEFIWLYWGESAANFSPNRTEIETGAFFPATIVDGWVAARPEEFAPAFIECWKLFRGKNRSNRNALI
jgi:16S rRNA (adenine1518-N6/adenine1519-N6)-dimethyltransferase